MVHFPLNGYPLPNALLFVLLIYAVPLSEAYQVAVAVGLGGDPLGRKVLGDGVSSSAGSVTTGADDKGVYLSVIHLL